MEGNPPPPLTPLCCQSKPSVGNAAVLTILLLNMHVMLNDLDIPHWAVDSLSQCKLCKS